MGATAPKEFDIEKTTVTSMSPNIENRKKHNKCIEYLVIFQGTNAILQFIADIILEVLS